MAQRLSRRKLSDYAAKRLAAGENQLKVIRELAAYLVDMGRTREQELLVRDLEQALAVNGIVIADVASAYALSSQLKLEVKKLVGGSRVQLREVVDPTLLGGIRVDIPGKRFDGTIRYKLQALKAKQL